MELFFTITIACGRVADVYGVFVRSKAYCQVLEGRGLRFDYQKIC